MGFFNWKKRVAAEQTFQEGVVEFWKWFEKNAARLKSTIDAGKCDSLHDETSRMVNTLHPNFGWVYGHKEGLGHSFTVSGEGIEHLQLLALHWLEMAPKIPNWIFHASRQPGPIKGKVIAIAGRKFDPKEIWVTPHIDAEAERIDLTIWHHSWSEIENGLKWQVVFLFLDEVLGEYGTGWWVGDIEFGDNRLAESFPLEELDQFVDSTKNEMGWKKYPPGESWSSLEVSIERKFPRSDIFVLTTMIPKFHREYFSADGKMENPFAGSGAEYVYITIQKDHFPPGNESHARGEIEDALDLALKNANSGRLLGGGLGVDWAYIDLLIYDGAKSTKIVQETLQRIDVPPGTTIQSFFN